MRRAIGYAALVLAGLGLVVAPLFRGTLDIESVAALVVTSVALALYGGLGGLVIWRRDGHLTGWLLVVVGLAIVFANNFPWLPGVSDSMVVWVESWSWTVVFAGFGLLTLTFPSGRLPAPTGGATTLARRAVFVVVVLVVIAPFTDVLGTPEVADDTVNPVGFLPAWLAWVPPLGTFLILAAAVVSLVVRRRRATGVERAQLSWVVFALAVLAAVIALTFAYILLSIAVGAGDPGDDAWYGVFVGMALFPVGFAVAILRYRLFEIDRIVSRTASYTVLVGTLATVFTSVTVALPRVLGLPDEPPLLVAVATLAVAAMFNPLRRRVQAGVDRRFNRAGYDAQQEVNRLADRLRDEVALDEVTQELIDVSVKTMQPVSVAVWVRGSNPSS